MAVSLRGSGSTVKGFKTSGTTIVLSPTVVGGMASTDSSILIVHAYPSSSSVATPAGWTSLISGITNYYQESYGQDSKSAAFLRQGIFTGPVSVTITSANGNGFATAVIQTYQKGASDIWDISAVIDAYDWS